MPPWEKYQSAGDRRNPWERYGSSPDGDRVGAFLSGAADSASFGFGDELKGLVFGDEERDAARRRQAQHRVDNPVSFGAGQVGGALVGGGGIGAGLRAAGVGARALQLGWASRAGIAALTGGAGTAAYGAGSAGDGERLQSAATNFLPGAVFGGGLSVAGSALGPVASRLWNGANPTRAAAQLAARGIEREGGAAAVTARLADHAAMNRGGTLLDAMGESGEQLAMGAANRPSAGRAAMRDMIETRNQAVGPRAQAEISAAITGGENAGEALTRLRTVQRTQAAPLYAQAWQEIGRVDPQRLQATVGETIRRHPDLFEPAMQHAQRMSLAETGQVIADRSDPRFWHYLLQGAERELGARMRAGFMGDIRGYQGSEIATYTRALRQFNDQVRRTLGPTFRRAQDTYSGAASAQEAVEAGYDAFRPNLNTLQLENIMARFNRMRPGDQQQFRAAFASRLQDSIASATTVEGRTDVLRGVIGTEGRRRLVERILGPQQTQALLRSFDYDRRMFQTGVNTGIRTNSHTAPILSAEAAQREATLTPSTAPGTMFERLFGPELRRAADVRNEQISTELLDMLSMPADDALTALQRGGALGTRRGLLSRAARQAQALRDQRRRATLGAFQPYAGIGGEPLVDYTMGAQ